MADGLDVVAVGVEHEGAVVIGVIVRSQPRRAVVFAAGLERCRIKGINGIAILGREGEVHASFDGLAAADPKLRASLGAKSGLVFAARLLGGDLHQEVIAQRRESHEIEGLRALVVGNWNAHMVKHGIDPFIKRTAAYPNRAGRVQAPKEVPACQAPASGPSIDLSIGLSIGPSSGPGILGYLRTSQAARALVSSASAEEKASSVKATSASVWASEI